MGSAARPIPTSNPAAMILFNEFIDKSPCVTHPKLSALPVTPTRSVPARRRLSSGLNLNFMCDYMGGPFRMACLGSQRQDVLAVIPRIAAAISYNRGSIGNRLNREATVQQDGEVHKFLGEHNIEHIKIGVFDTDGILRGKYLNREKFISGLTKSLGFCDVILGWDSNDQLYDNTKFTGWHTAYPDATVRVLTGTQREIPFEPKTALFLGEFAGPAELVCPRGTLRRVLERAETMGYLVSAAAEFEFFLFEETPQSVRDKGYRQLKTMTPGAFGYSVLRSSVHSDLYHELLDLGQTMRFPIEGLHTETGPGVLEAALSYCDALEAADRAALFKTFTKVLAQRHGLMATFMAKWSNAVPGQSGHLHISMRTRQGESVFHDASKPHDMSDAM